MSRHGSRSRAGRPARPVLALATALGTLAVCLFAFLATSPSAGAVTLGASNNGSVSVAWGDSLNLTAASSQPLLLGYQGVNFAGLGVTAQIPKGSTATIGPLKDSGSHTVAWQAYCTVVAGVTCHPKTYVMTVIIGDQPPPPSSSDPGQPSSSDGGGGTPTGGQTSPTTSTGASSGTSSPGSSPTGTASTPGGSTSINPGGISIGPGPVIQTGGNIPIGFGPPPRDPNNPTPSIPDATGSGVGVVPGGTPTTGSPSESTSTQTLVELANSTPKLKDRPTGLAIVSIGVLAIVASLYAYRRLGEQAQRAGH